MVTPALFAQAVLGRLGLPISENNIAALVAFQSWEGGHMNNTARFNPMNTMRDVDGAEQARGLVKGIKAYATWDDGVEGTALTLAQGNMRGIYNALARSAPADETLRAVASSPWGCTICAKAPAVTLQGYANKVFPDGASITRWGEGMGLGLERFVSGNAKFIVGAFVVVGGSFLLLGIAKARRDRVLRSA
jgi:hypothetical protein